jgi:hypothetical protein
VLVIRKEQMQALQDYRRAQFERRALAYLRQTLPTQCSSLDDATLCEEVRFGVARAADYGITAERDVAGYLELTLLLGREFDADAAFPWARPILLDRSSSAENRLRRLRTMARREGQIAGSIRQGA